MSGEARARTLPADAELRRLRVPIARAEGTEDLPYPAYHTPGSAGADLYAALQEPLLIEMGQVHLVPCGIHLAIPAGWEGQLRPRSGMALRSGLTLVNAPGTIDADYRGEIQLVITCLKREACTIRRGDRIAQIVFAPVGRASFVPVRSLDATQRGNGGFGHSGSGLTAPGGLSK